MLKTITTIFSATCLIIASYQAAGAPKTIELPEETARLKQSAHPGYQVAQICLACHSADYINMQPPRMNLKQWAAEVGKMQHTYGAPVTDADAKLISEYLAVTYGSEKLANTQP